MKRILFYYDSYCGGSSHGGTEVATSRIARALRASGKWEVYNACKRRRDSLDECIYADVKVLRNRATFVGDLADFIRRHEIDVVVNMGRFYRHGKLRRAIAASGRDAKLLFMHHFAPGSESKKHTYAAGWHLLRLAPVNPGYWVRSTVYPLFKLQRRLCLGRMYRKVLEDSSAVVLLSDGYRDGYLRKAYGDRWTRADGSKLFAIPNIFEKENTVPREGLPSHGENRKEKRVLLLSRMDEIQKRISLALEIWSKIEKMDALEEWRLDIVGSGHDMKALRKLADRLGLRRATFHGWADSRPFLERSQILMTTSDYEGLSLAMIEAQTYGCVPVAFNSYASLADIVEDGETGVVVAGFGDTDAFASRLSALMLSNEERRRMALKAAGGAAEKFSPKRVASLWMRMLDTL